MAGQAAREKTGAPRRKRGPYARSSQTRERILAAALEVAAEVGIHRTSVAAIAARAGVASGNLHYHFGSRDELLRELMEWVRAEANGGTEQAFADHDDFLAAEEASFRAYLAFVHRNPAYVRLVEEVRLHEPELYREGMSAWLRLFRKGLERASCRGEIRRLASGEIAALAHLLMGTRYFLDQMILGVDGTPYPGDETVVAAHLGLVRGGLARGVPNDRGPQTT